MRSTHLSSIPSICMLCLSVIAAIGPARAVIQPKSPISIEDVLNIEGIGAAEFSPDGRWLAYNLVPPYDTLKDYSYWLFANSMSGHRVWLKDLNSDEGPLLQPGLNANATNYIFGFSPNGEFLIVIEHYLGKLRIVACKTGRDQCVRFKRTLDIRDMYVSAPTWNERLEWTSPETFVFPTREQFEPGSEMRSRGIAGAFLWEQWNRAWRGEGPTATEVVSTGRDRSNEWSSGELYEFDVRSGHERSIRQGRFAGVHASRKHGLLVAAQVGVKSRPPAHPDMELSETHPIFDRRYALRVIDSRTGRVRKVDGPFSIDPNSIEWSPDGNSFIVYGWEHDQAPSKGTFYWVELDDLKAHQIELENQKIADSTLARDPPYFFGPARAVALDSGIALLAFDKQSPSLHWHFLGADGQHCSPSATMRQTGQIA